MSVEAAERVPTIGNENIDNLKTLIDRNPKFRASVVIGRGVFRQLHGLDLLANLAIDTQFTQGFDDMTTKIVSEKRTPFAAGNHEDHGSVVALKQETSHILDVAAGVRCPDTNIPTKQDLEPITRMLTELRCYDPNYPHLRSLTHSLTTLLNDLNKADNTDASLKGFIMPIAKTLATGHQGVSLWRLYETMLPDLLRSKIYPIPVLRNQDYQEFGLAKNNDSFIKLLEALHNLRLGFAVFPEGTTKSGKQKTGEYSPLRVDNIRGIQHLEDGDNSLGIIVKTLLRSNPKGIAIFPFGSHGEYRVHNPDTRRFRKEGILQALSPFDPNPVRMIAGLPILGEDMMEQIKFSTGKSYPKATDITHFIMSQIAVNVPPYARGIYTDVKITYPYKKNR